MKQEKEYLKQKLKEAGIKTPVYTSMKKLKAANELMTGAVLVNGETFRRSSSKKDYTDQQGQKKRRVKLFTRNTSFHVVIASTDEDKCEDILFNFLNSLDKGIIVDGNWTEITVSEADWVDKDDSILKAQIAVQLDIEFTGGIYKDHDRKKMQLGRIEID